MPVVRLADDKTLDIADVGDVVLKTSFGTSWTLKDVRYILGLKRRLISVRQLDEEVYHVGFGDHQWKVTKSSLVVAHENKRGSLYMVKVHPEGIGVIIDGSGSAALGWNKFIQKDMALHLLHQSEDPATMILLSKTAVGVAFGVAERLSRTIRAESTGIREPCFAINSSSLTKPIQKSQVVLVDIPENLVENDSIVAEHGLSSEITQSPAADLVLDVRGYEEFDSKLRINQQWVSWLKLGMDTSSYGSRHVGSLIESPGGSSDTSEGSKNSRASRIVEDQIKNTLKTEHPQRREAPRLHMYKDLPESPGLHYEDDYNQRGFLACWKERKPRVQIERKSIRTDSSTEAMVDDMLVAGSNMEEFNKPKWQLPLVFEMKDRCFKKQVLGYVLTVGVTIVEYTKSPIHLVKNLKVCSWAKLVRILISEGSLSLLNILGTKSLAEMYTMLVMKDKLKFCAA
ncbi:hypothetical protein Tco_0537686, partial [Tanacetum coccineum]